MAPLHPHPMMPSSHPHPMMPSPPIAPVPTPPTLALRSFQQRKSSHSAQPQSSFADSLTTSDRAIRHLRRAASKLHSLPRLAIPERTSSRNVQGRTLSWQAVRRMSPGFRKSPRNQLAASFPHPLAAHGIGHDGPSPQLPLVNEELHGTDGSTFTRVVLPTDIINVPELRNRRFRIEIRLAAPVCIGGAPVEGELRIATDLGSFKCRRRNQPSLSLGRLSIDLIGFETCQGQHAIFRNLAVQLIGDGLPPPPDMTFLHDPLPDSFWPLLPSLAVLPFRLHLPIDVGPPPFSSRHAQIRYVLSITATLRSGEQTFHVRETQNITLLKPRDPDEISISLPSPVLARNVHILSSADPHEEVQLTASLRRQTWVSGMALFVDMRITNQSRRLIKRIDIELEEVVAFYRSSTASEATDTTTATIDTARRLTERTEKRTLTVSTTKTSRRGWQGIAPEMLDERTWMLQIPGGVASVETGRFFSVQHFLGITVHWTTRKRAPAPHTAPTLACIHSTDGTNTQAFAPQAQPKRRLSVQLPLTVVHPNTIDVPPNAVGPVAIALERKRSLSHSQSHSDFAARPRHHRSGLMLTQPAVLEEGPEQHSPLLPEPLPAWATETETGSNPSPTFLEHVRRSRSMPKRLSSPSRLGGSAQPSTEQPVQEQSMRNKSPGFVRGRSLGQLRPYEHGHSGLDRVTSAVARPDASNASGVPNLTEDRKTLRLPVRNQKAGLISGSKPGELQETRVKLHTPLQRPSLNDSDLQDVLQAFPHPGSAVIDPSSPSPAGQPSLARLKNDARDLNTSNRPQQQANAPMGDAMSDWFTDEAQTEEPRNTLEPRPQQPSTADPKLSVGIRSTEAEGFQRSDVDQAQADSNTARLHVSSTYPSESDEYVTVDARSGAVLAHKDNDANVQTATHAGFIHEPLPQVPASVSRAALLQKPSCDIEVLPAMTKQAGLDNASISANTSNNDMASVESSSQAVGVERSPYQAIDPPSSWYIKTPEQQVTSVTDFVETGHSAFGIATDPATAIDGPSVNGTDDSQAATDQSLSAEEQALERRDPDMPSPLRVRSRQTSAIALVPEEMLTAMASMPEPLPESTSNDFVPTHVQADDHQEAKPATHTQARPSRAARPAGIYLGIAGGSTISSRDAKPSSARVAREVSVAAPDASSATRRGVDKTRNAPRHTPSSEAARPKNRSEPASERTNATRTGGPSRAARRTPQDAAAAARLARARADYDRRKQERGIAGTNSSNTRERRHRHNMGVEVEVDLSSARTKTRPERAKKASRS